MLSTYTDAIGWTLQALVIAAGILTILAPLLLAAIALRTPARRIRWRYDAWNHRAR
jgi:hypothetical protein